MAQKFNSMDKVEQTNTHMHTILSQFRNKLRHNSVKIFIIHNKVPPKFQIQGYSVNESFNTKYPNKARQWDKFFNGCLKFVSGVTEIYHF